MGLLLAAEWHNREQGYKKLARICQAAGVDFNRCRKTAIAKIRRPALQWQLQISRLYWCLKAKKYTNSRI
jgi:hypothetical protein